MRSEERITANVHLANSAPPTPVPTSKLGGSRTRISPFAGRDALPITSVKRTVSQPASERHWPTLCPVCGNYVTYYCPNLSEALIVCSKQEVRAAQTTARDSLPATALYLLRAHAVRVAVGHGRGH